MNATVQIQEIEATKVRLTLADVCWAIADGKLPARQQGRWYAIRKRDVAHYASRCVAPARFEQSRALGAAAVGSRL